MEQTGKYQGWHSQDGNNRYAGLGVTMLLHLAVIVALLQYEPVRTALFDAAPIMVSLITPQPIVEKPRELPAPLPVRPRVPQPTPEPRQMITAVSEIPAPMAPTPPPPAPVVAAPPPQAAPVAAVPVAPVPVIPPNFNADYLDNPPPVYPAVSRRMGEQGKVVLRVLVNIKGSADKVELKSSSNSDRLDAATLEIVKRWRFIPARQGDQPVAAWVLIPITFSLKG